MSFNNKDASKDLDKAEHFNAYFSLCLQLTVMPILI